MKVLAIGNAIKLPTDEERCRIMAVEVPETLQMYLDGKIEQFWFRPEPIGVVFLTTFETVAEAEKELSKLPLVREGFMKFDLHAVGPLKPLQLLIQPK